MRTDNNNIVYRHRRLDTNEIFYVGIGSIKRSKEKHNRNTYWKNIVKFTSYTIEIIAENLDWDTACELETFLIQEYGRKDLGLGLLCNLTNGGDGGDGCSGICSENTKLKISKANLGNKHTDETKKLISIKNKGKIRTEEFKIKISDIQKGRTLSIETRNKIIENHKKPMSKKVINIETNEIFNSIKIAAEMANMSFSSFYNKLRNKKNFNYEYYV